MKWGDDFLRTQAEYTGVLEPRTCDHCENELLTVEDAYEYEEYEQLCYECCDFLMEEDGL